MSLAIHKAKTFVKSVARRHPVKKNAIAEAMRRQIVAGRLPPGARLPTRRGLARHHGVSVNTVQDALSELAHDGLVVAHGRRGAFVAKRLPHLARCGLVLPPLSDRPDHVSHKPFYAALRTEALRQRQRDNLELKIYENVVGHANDPQFLRLADDLRRCQLAGLIVMDPGMFAAMPLTQLRQVNLPIVSISATAGPDFLRVHPNQEQMIEQALDYFATHGRRRIAVLDQGPWHWEFIQAALAQRGLETRPSWLQFVPAAARETARGMMRLLLQGRELPEGLFIADDSLVEPATAGLRDEGGGQSNPIDVVALGNFPAPTRSHVPCHRIGFDVREVLATCVHLIQQRRQGESVPAVTEITPVWDGQWCAKPVNKRARA